ncbi:membrane-bound lytic murein transglycosylase MltF [Frischella sp. Ac48]|uniref:membrane-bound lytic murein transglycosylase MltF n=1 Tax=Frischella sp. Ac48 TaxID=2804531 RepID=UPI001C7D7F6F|nr:membrane-bound lytic murein transglycosylase MltF [Frischella sp. Ac48]MBX4132987.1 membrane-bound lytic murein transglycosylase MltF [Frischella sp. Ac48]
MIKKVALWSGSLVTIILIILAIVFALFFKEKIRAKEIQPQSTILQKISEQKELRVGMLRSLTTLYVDYRNPNVVGGFEYALLKKFSDSLNVKLKIIFANTLPELIEKSRDGKIDLLAAQIKGYPEELTNFDASEAFHPIVQQLVYLKGSAKPYSFVDIKGNLTIPKYSSQSYILRNISTQYSELNWHESDILNQEELLKLVVDKKIDYTIANHNTIAIMQRIYPLLTVAFTVDDNWSQNWYFPKSQDHSLRDKFNHFIKKAYKDGTIQKLEYHYFNHMNKFDYVDTQRFIQAIKQTLPKYQAFFEKYASSYELDWKLIAAISYQESHWNPKAASSTGVRGMMMLTKPTADSLGIKNRLDAEQSIKGGTIYIKQIINRIPDTIPNEERIWFALAAYNMGMGHLWDARSLAIKLNKNPDSWQDVRQILPLLSEEEYYTDLKYGFARGYQAVHFVDSIQQYYMSLVGYLLESELRQKHIDEKFDLISLDFASE